ncbi:hypothetical protein F444_18117 [Phytophthora nicotianae P1976]|uniref:Uncharacterized protein n=1 Tax=Phytophthora nicotianae P1976 TaxID=1317066 RepID=A0A080ZCG3_PHYNI|nr:hypothetical protein F444_18117 [Phytophthora nicotianae P1976]
MQTIQPSPLSTPKSATALWTARLIATLWKLAVSRARKLRRQSQSDTTNPDTGSDFQKPTPEEELDEASIMHEAALSVVASGVISLADFEAVTGYSLSKNHNREIHPTNDDASSEAATDMSDCCSIASSDVYESILEEELSVSSSTRRLSVCKPLSSKSAKWVCVGYGRYVKVLEKL